MKKILFISIFLTVILSTTLFAHDYIWGINQNELIHTKGQPDKIEKNGVQEVYTYKVSSFGSLENGASLDIGYSFSNNRLTKVLESYSFVDIKLALVEIKLLLYKLDRQYELIKETLDENGNLTVYFKHGNDMIEYHVYRMEISGILVIPAMILYISPLESANKR